MNETDGQSGQNHHERHDGDVSSGQNRKGQEGGQANRVAGQIETMAELGLPDLGGEMGPGRPFPWKDNVVR
jgi:hypothetical protein